MLRSTLAGLLAAGVAATWLVQAHAQSGARLAQDAAKAQAEGNTDQAINLFTEALKDAALPNDRRAVLLTDRGALYARQNQPKAAIEDFNRAVQLYPEYPAIYNNRGSTLLTLGLVREAIKDFDRAIVLAPGYAAAYNNRAGAHMLVRQTAEAIRDYTRAIELGPTSIAPLNGRGRALLAADRPQAAMRDFSRALATDARFSLGYRSRAEAKLAVERYSDAVEDLSRAIAFDPNNAEIYVQRGQAWLAAKNLSNAIKDFSRAIEMTPRHAPAYEARALAHIKLEAWDEADADLARAIELDPRSAGAMAVRAYFYTKTGQAMLGAREIDKAVKLEVERADVLWAKGEVEEALGRREDAVRSYRAALALRASFKDAIAGLERLGAQTDQSEAVPLRGAGVHSWQVVRRGQRYFAVSDEHPRISVPLEMVGEGTPRLIEWERRGPPHKDIALLRFAAGSVRGPKGAEEAEQVAILDLADNSVIGVIPHRQGSKQARWTWEDAKLVVASVDGLTDEFTLKAAKPEVSAAAPSAQPRPRFSEGPRYAPPPSWLPWDFGNNAPYRGGSGGGPPPQQRRGQQPKTLFDILLGK